MKQDLFDSLAAILGRENVRTAEPMQRHTTFKIGGQAEYFLTPSSEEQLRRCIACLLDRQVPYYIIGNGSNLLVGDKGVRGAIIQLYDKFNAIRFEGSCCHVQAGCLLSRLGMQAAQRGLSGLEFATGIPGTVGGAVVMNAGAYGGEIKNCIVSARLMNMEGEVRTYNREELALGYRTSVASEGSLIVLGAEFELQQSDREEILARINELAVARRKKQPLEYPSAGSTFKRPEGYFAGKLIEDAGLKGFAIGGAQVSMKHSGFVINTGNATAMDVVSLIEHIQRTVEEKLGVRLELEVRKIGIFN